MRGHVAIVLLLTAGCRFESTDTTAPERTRTPRFLERRTAIGDADWPLPEDDCAIGRFMARGAAIADVDQDGDDDIFLPHPAGPDRLFFAEGGRFVEQPFDGAGGAGAIFFDADDDGDLDLFVGAVGRDPPRFYTNDGGAFVRRDVGLEFAPDPNGCYLVFGASAADADGDGDLDLFTAAWVDADGTRYFENLGRGTFVDRTFESGLAAPDTAGLVPFPTDLDEDGDLDLILAADFSHTRVFSARGDKTFEDITKTSTIPRIHDAMGIDAGDIDGDGDLDYFVSGICHRIGDFCNDAFYWTGNRLFLSDGTNHIDATETAGVKDAGWAWGAAFFDADLDGDLDLGVTNGYRFVGLFDDDPLRLFDNDGTGRFVDVAARDNVVLDGHTRSIVPFDLGNDGDLDLLVTSAEAPPKIFENRTDAPARALQVDLVQPWQRNRFAIGAQVRVRLDDGRWLRRDVRANSNFVSTRPPRAHFGLGARRAVAIEVTWPDGEVQAVHRDRFDPRVRIERRR